MDQIDRARRFCIDQIDRVRRAHAQRHVTGVQSLGKNHGKKITATKSMPCQSFLTQVHVYMLRLMKQKGCFISMCAPLALQKNKKKFPHPEVECRKSKQTKDKGARAWAKVSWHVSIDRDLFITVL